MADDHAPGMTSREYFTCLERAADAASAAEVRRLRAEVLARWRGDPRADDRAEALHTHQERLAEREQAATRLTGRLTSRQSGYGGR